MYLVKPVGMAELGGTEKYLVGRARQEVTKSETSQANTCLFQSRTIHNHYNRGGGMGTFQISYGYKL